jgi:dTDP-4-amino-4,6-dideoxygalactose transaminase
MPRFLPPSASPLLAADIVAATVEALTGQRAVLDFGQALRDRFQAAHCHFASCGRGALSLLFFALRALDPSRDTVSLPAFTSYSVPAAAVRAGLKVALYDLDPATLCPEPASFRRSLGPRTVGAVICHLFGYPCSMEEPAALAAEWGVPLVDDAAQALGATLDGRPVGMLGRAGLLSLGRGKNITAVDGGVILTNDARLSQAIRDVPLAPARLGDIPLLAAKALALLVLQHPALYWLPQSLPFLGIGESVFDPDFPLRAISPFQAALGRRMLARLDAINASRIRNAHDMVTRVAKPDRFPAPAPGARPVFLRLPCLGQGGREYPQLGMVRSYPQALCDIEALRPHLAGEGDAFAVARRLALELVTLPTHAFVAAEDIQEIAGRVA